MRSAFLTRSFALAAIIVSLVVGFSVNAQEGVALFATFNLLALGASGLFSNALGAALAITAANVKASSKATRERRFNAGAGITAGQPVYLDANNKWQLNDANVAAAFGPNVMRGMAEHGSLLDQPLSVIISDPEYTHGGAATVGLIYVVSATAGAICPSADLIGGDAPTVLFVADTAAVGQLQPLSGKVVQ